jgi:WD40 repeat protein
VVVTTNTKTWKTTITVHGAEHSPPAITFPNSDDIQLTADGLFALRDAHDDADPCLRGYDLVSGKLVPHMQSIRGWPFRVSGGSPSRVAVADPHTYEVSVYRVADGEKLFAVPGTSRGWFAPASVSDLVVVFDEPDRVTLRGVDTNRVLSPLDGGFLFEWSADDSVLVAQALQDQVVVWRTDTGEEQARWRLGQRAYLSDVSSTGRRVVTWGDRDISVWSADTGTRLGRIESSADVADARFLGEGRVAGLLRDGRAFEWQVEISGRFSC